MTEHLNKFQDVINQLTSIDVKFTYELQVFFVDEFTFRKFEKIGS